MRLLVGDCTLSLVIPAHIPHSTRASEAGRFLKATSWRLEAALDAFYNDAAAVRAADLHREQSTGGASVRNLEKLWERYRGEQVRVASMEQRRADDLSIDPKQLDETGIDGTILYCQDLGVEPEDVVMLAVAWLTKAPTMGRFAKKGWIDGWKEAR